jgi:hypothetical protein
MIKHLSHTEKCFIRPAVIEPAKFVYQLGIATVSCRVLFSCIHSQEQHHDVHAVVRTPAATWWRHSAKKITLGQKAIKMNETR